MKIYELNDFTYIDTVDMSKVILLDKPYEKCLCKKYSEANEIEFPEFSLKENHNVQYNCSGVIYITFGINVEKITETILTFHNNYKIAKIWCNDELISICDGWYEKILLKLKPGLSTFCFEIVLPIDLNFFFISFSPKNAVLDRILKIKDEYLDVKKYYIVSDNEIIDEKEYLEFTIGSDYISQNRIVSCYIVYRDIDKIGQNDEYKILQEFKVRLFEKQKVNISEILNNKKYDNIILGISEPININDKLDPTKLTTKRFFIKKFLSSIINDISQKCNNKINNEPIEFKHKLLKLYSSYISSFDSIEGIYYWYLSLLVLYEKLKKCNTYEEYLKMNVINDVVFESSLDGKKIRFAASYPTKVFKSVPVIIIISTTETKAHILNVKKNFGDTHLIIECSARGKTFGNFIAESSVLEIYNYISKYYNIDKKRCYLLGFSSCGVVVSSLLSKYPDVFTGGLAVASLMDKSLISNTYNTALINVCGEYDKNFDKNYLEKKLYFDNQIQGYNILVKNNDNATISSILSNKYLIKKLLRYSKSKKSNKHFLIDNMLFNSAYGITVEEKCDSLKPCFFELKYNDGKTILNLHNVKVFKIDAIKLRNLMVFIDNKFITKIKCSSNVYYIYNEKKFEINNEESNNKNYDEQKLEILNVFYGPLKIVVPKELNDHYVVNGLINPSTLVEETKFKINYPQINDDLFDFKGIEDCNYIVFNRSINDYNKLYLKNEFKYIDSIFDKEDYSVMQVLPNYKFKNRFILFVNYSSIKSLEKNFWLRKFVIPSDYSYNSSLLRNFAIIKLSKKYYYVKNARMDLQYYE